jgi:hypothetical protein
VQLWNEIVGELRVHLAVTATAEGMATGVFAASVLDQTVESVPGCVTIRTPGTQEHGEMGASAAVVVDVTAPPCTPVLNGGWRVWRMTNQGYYWVEPSRQNPSFNSWPFKRLHKGSRVNRPTYVHHLAAHAHAGGLCKIQDDFSVERENGHSTKLVISHLCGNTSCIRPAHMAFQTRKRDALDRSFHRSHGKGVLR